MLGDRVRFFAVAVVVGLPACASEAPPATSVACGALESYQGPELQGMSPNGMNINGMSPQGMSSQGVSFQGINAQGLASQGMGVQGLGVQGLGAQGTREDGVLSPNGLGAFALRGVTEEQASAWLSGTGTDVHPANVVRLSLEAGILRGRTPEGGALDEAELVGTLLPFFSSAGDPLWIRLTSVAVHPTVDELRLYTLQFNGENLCGDEGSGLFVPGIWDETGARADSRPESAASGSIDTTFSCTTGVIAKCVVWGYRPWTEGAEIHEACTRMARADYCGDGVPHTQNGTLIDMFDPRGIQEAVADDGMSFEAGWGPEGAVCVREPRYIDVTANGEVKYPSCWADKPRCDTWEEATAAGATLGNNSFHALRQESACP